MVIGGQPGLVSDIHVRGRNNRLWKGNEMIRNALIFASAVCAGVSVIFISVPAALAAGVVGIMGFMAREDV